MPQSLLTDDDFQELFRKHRTGLLKYCMARTGSADAADDLCQEALATAWEKRHTFRGDSSFLTWLVGVAKYLHLNQVRKKSEALSEDGIIAVSDPSYPVLKDLTAQEREIFVKDVVQCCLGDDEQNVVWLRYGQELPLAVIDAQLNLPGKSGARGVLQRIRRKLQTEFRARLAELGHGTSLVRTRW